MPGWLLWTAAEEWHGVAGSVSPAANGSTDDAPVPKGLPPPAPPKGLEEGFPKGDAELLPLASPKGLPAHLVTNVHRRSRARGRRDGAEMDHDVCAPYAIAPYPIGDAREEPRGAFSDFFLDRTAPRALNPQSLEHTATVPRWKWTNLPRCRFAICGRLPPGQCCGAPRSIHVRHVEWFRCFIRCWEVSSCRRE